MTRYKEYNMGARGQNPLGTFGPILMMVLVLFLLFYAIKGLFTILSIVAPVLLLVTLIMDRGVVIDYVKFVTKLLKENTIAGIFAVILSVLGWHVVAGFLFAKAMMKRGLNRMADQIKDREEGEYTDYEEVEEEDEDFLILEQKEKVTQQRSEGNEYDDLFK